LGPGGEGVGAGGVVFDSWTKGKEWKGINSPPPPPKYWSCSSQYSGCLCARSAIPNSVIWTIEIYSSFYSRKVKRQ